MSWGAPPPQQYVRKLTILSFKIVVASSKLAKKCLTKIVWYNDQAITILHPYLGSLELYDRNTCYTTDDGRQVMAKANPKHNCKPNRLY